MCYVAMFVYNNITALNLILYIKTFSNDARIVSFTYCERVSASAIDVGFRNYRPTILIIVTLDNTRC